MADDVMPRPPAPAPQAPRLAFGILVLLIVDFIWVASSELTEYIFKQQNFNKPFFSTYVKTSLFMLYLPGFLLYKPWRDQCVKGSPWMSNGERTSNGYHSLNAEDIDATDEGEEGDSEVEDNSLSTPSFQPIAGISTDKSSGTDSEPDNGSKKVRFSRVAEVREMSASEALQANLSRLSYAASLRAAAALQRAAVRLTIGETARLALTFSVMWFMGNYSYQAALSDTEAGIVNVLSASSCFFTLVLSALFPSNAADSPTLTKAFAVAFTIAGVVLVSYSDLKIENGAFPVGSLWALSGTVFYSSYIVFLRRKIDHEDKLDVPMFFAFVGLFNFLLLWPVFFILHYTNYETFELPNRQQWLALVANGVVGTVLSELLWLFGCFCTSSLIATLAISLTIPLTMFADVIIKKVSYDTLFYIGSMPMFLSFFIVALLTHWNNWDPMLETLQLGVRKLTKIFCPQKQRRRRIIAESLENESLIESEVTSQTDA